jgi:hypothetical protein
MQSNFTRKVERTALEYAKSLKPDLPPEEVKKIFEDLEEQHAIIEAKLTIIGVIYRAALADALRQEEREIIGPAGLG